MSTGVVEKARARLAKHEGIRRDYLANGADEMCEYAEALLRAVDQLKKIATSPTIAEAKRRAMITLNALEVKP